MRSELAIIFISYTVHCKSLPLLFSPIIRHFIYLQLLAFINPTAVNILVDNSGYTFAFVVSISLRGFTNKWDSIRYLFCECSCFINVLLQMLYFFLSHFDIVGGILALKNVLCMVNVVIFNHIYSCSTRPYLRENLSNIF